MKEKGGIPQFIGVRIRRREDPALITGRGKYVADIQLDGTLYMALVRSPYAHAKILEIDTEEAVEMDGVVAIYTAETVNGHFQKPLAAGGMSPAHSDAKEPRRYPLAGDKVRHTGEPVAVVLAETPYAATDAAEMVFVDYDPLDPVVDPDAALAEDAPLVHDEWEDNVAFRWGMANGDVEAAFKSAETVVELTLINQRVIGNPMEPRAVLATYNADDEGYTVWSTTQIPHILRGELAAMLGVEGKQVRVIAPEVGGGFGVKANVYAEEALAPFLAEQLGRPVKWVATRSEDFLATAHGRSQIDTIRLAADKSGRVRAADLHITVDCGAYYTRVTPLIPTLTALMMNGVYDFPAVRAQATAVFTNKHAIEPYRGAGRPEAAYLVERIMDALADELGLDPAEVRRRNFIPPEKFPFKTSSNARYDSGEYDKALTKVLDIAAYASLREEQKRRLDEGGNLLGIGVACYVEVCGFGPFEMGSVSMDAAGHVTVLTGTSPHGQGHETTWAQIAAETLQVPMEDITVKHGDTAVVPRGIGTFGSRSTPVGGSAVRENSHSVRTKAEKIAAHLLEAADVDVQLNDGRFQVVGVPERSLSWPEVAKAAHGDDLPEELRGLESDVDFKPQGNTYPFGAHVCVVEIDPDTGEIDLVQYVTVDDCGTIINPLLVEGQVHGGIAQGVGQALLERAVYDEMGNLITGSLLDYAMPRADTFPWYNTNHTETPSPLNALGVKGIGEAATIGSTPATVNAVVDALSHLGINHLDMPLTAEKVWRALHQ